jgi:DNA-binding IscR family transcriptional regulator
MLRSPKDVNLGQVIRLIDGPLAPIPCVSQMAYSPCDDCPDERTCLLRLVMKEVRDANARILEQTTLEGMLVQKKQFENDGFALDYTI